MKKAEIVVGGFYRNSRNLVRLVIAEGPEFVFKQGQKDTDCIRFVVIKNPGKAHLGTPGTEQNASRACFANWARARVEAPKDGFEYTPGKAKAVATPKVEAPKPVAKPKAEAPKAVAAPKVEAPKTVAKAKNGKPSKRTFYLTPAGVITKAKPEAFTKTLRAQNAEEARKLFAL
jgi:hypothetical protein